MIPGWLTGDEDQSFDRYDYEKYSFSDKYLCWLQIKIADKLVLVDCPDNYY